MEQQIIKDLLHEGEFAAPRHKRLNSKKKGNKWESDVVKLLKNKFPDKEFARTPGSGAFGTTHSLPKNLLIYEDIIIPEDFRYLIECKAGYADLHFTDLFDRKSTLINWINKIQYKSNELGRDWLIMYKRNHKEPIVITNRRIRQIKNNISFYISDLKIRVYMYQQKEFFNTSSVPWFFQDLVEENDGYID